MQLKRLLNLLGFSTVTLISAFLVFQVQPVISKAVLPWFGGSPAVWTTCMLFFQVVLFAGYTYAHSLTTYLTPRYQGVVHFLLLVGALLVLPITPGDEWKPDGKENPTWQILLILGANVGLPYFLLSATGPLLQAWFSRVCDSKSPYRLYALSNVGSLAALLSYPVLVEPLATTRLQGTLWSAGFCLFSVMCAYLAASLGRISTRDRDPVDTGPAVACDTPTAWRLATWLLLPALASTMLLATTNHVCQDVAVIPFLWVAPLALYLLTFIISFDRERWYSRRWFAGLAVVAILGACSASRLQHIWPLVPEVLLHFAILFLVCMVCHGELVRSKPDPRYLTLFYLLSSAGGALGGILVALVCPLVFRTYFEMNLCLILGATVCMTLLCYDLRNGFLLRPQRRLVGALATLAVFIVVLSVQTDRAQADTVVAKRSFYGTLKVDISRSGNHVGMSLLHGRIIHGFQFAHPELIQFPTTYYAPTSGVGLALRHLRKDEPMRVGAVGLGVGTVSAYAKKGDTYRFYEINPAMVEVAQKTFAFLSSCPAEVQIALGDARLSLEREPGQDFDVLVLDAFSGDSIPAHLLTREAFAIYRRHLQPDGVIAVHISNRHLNLAPVVLRQAEHLRMQCIAVTNDGEPAKAVMLSKWMLLTNNETFLQRPEIAQVSRSYVKRPDNTFPLWTDQYNNLFQVLRVF